MRKWELKRKEFTVAKEYIARRLKESRSYLPRKIRAKALKEFKEKVRGAKTLQRWIEKYLAMEQIKRLRIYLRVYQSRKGKKLQTITIEADARKKLADYSKKHNVTLSQAIEMLIQKCGK